MSPDQAANVLHNCLFLVAVLETKRKFRGIIREFRCPVNEDW